MTRDELKQRIETLLAVEGQPDADDFLQDVLALFAEQEAAEALAVTKTQNARALKQRRMGKAWERLEREGWDTEPAIHINDEGHLFVHRRVPVELKELRRLEGELVKLQARAEAGWLKWMDLTRDVENGPVYVVVRDLLEHDGHTLGTWKVEGERVELSWVTYQTEEIVEVDTRLESVVDTVRSMLGGGE